MMQLARPGLVTVRHVLYLEPQGSTFGFVWAYQASQDPSSYSGECRSVLCT